MENWPLLVFTVLVQGAIGIIIFTTIAQRFNKEAVFKIPLVTAAGMAAVGVVASLLHLGRPLIAFHALARFGSSWLSREIWFSSVFTGLAVVIALLILFKPSAKGLVKVLIPIAALLGLIDVYAMASSYNFASVPAWKTSATFIQFYTTMISVGAALFLGLGEREAAGMRRGIAITACVAIGVQVIAMINYYLQLGTNSSEVARQSADLLKNMGIGLILQWACILAGGGLLLATLKSSKETVSLGGTGANAEVQEAAVTDTVLQTNTRILFLGLIALIIGQIIGRYLFYAVMVTSRVGLN